jgi:hypothetical protein
MTGIGVDDVLEAVEALSAELERPAASSAAAAMPVGVNVLQASLRPSRRSSPAS